MNKRQLDHNAHKPTPTKYPLCFLANDIKGPANIGSLFRIADALGVEKIYLSGNSATPPNRKIKQTSRSTENHVPYFYEQNALSVAKKLKVSGYMIVSLEISTNSIDLEKLSIAENEKICLVLGSEKQGICEPLLNLSDVVIKIPMLGINSSMNVASACAIAAYKIRQSLAPISLHLAAISEPEASSAKPE